MIIIHLQNNKWWRREAYEHESLKPIRRMTGATFEVRSGGQHAFPSQVCLPVPRSNPYAYSNAPHLVLPSHVTSQGAEAARAVTDDERASEAHHSR